MRKFDIFYEFRLFCRQADHFLCNFVVMVQAMYAYPENVLPTVF